MYSGGLKGCGCGCSGGCKSKGLGGLGDTTVGDVVGAVTCIDDMCNIGKASVDLMNATYNALPADQQQSFQVSVQSINDTFNNTYSWYSGLIPFNPTCCTVLDIGKQADALTSTMNPSAGAGPSTTAAANIPSAGSLTAGVGAGLGLLAVIVLGAAYVMHRA